MLLGKKPVRELDEIIAFFNNKAKICGSLCDLIHIKYAGKINDYDFILNEEDFLYSFNLEKNQDKIENHLFRLIRCDLRTFGNVKYYGYYKNKLVDIFLDDASHTEMANYIEISSKCFYDNSMFNNYRIQDKHARKSKLLALRDYIDSLVTVIDWRKNWKIVKEQQLKEKLPLYHEQ